MLQNLKASHKLYLLLLIASLLIIVTGGFCISEMRIMNQNTQTLDSDRVLPLQQLSDIRYTLFSEVLNTVSESDNHVIEPSKAINNLSDAEKIINSNWQNYLKTYLTVEEEKIAKQTGVLLSDMHINISRFKQWLTKNPSGGSNNEFSADLRFNVNKVITNINLLRQLQIQVAGQVSRANSDLYKKSVKKILLLCVLFFVFSVVLGYFIIEDIRRLVKELKISNLKIKASEEKCRAFIKYAGDAIFMIDPNFQIIDINDSACNLLYYTKEELLSMKISEIVSDEEKRKIAATFDELNKSDSILFEQPLKRRDQSIIDTEMNLRLLDDDIGYIAITRDITQRKIAESDIKKSEEKYRYLFENNPAFIIIWDLENLKVLEVNDQVLNTYGYTKEEWNKMSILEYRHASDHERIKQFAQAKLRNEQTSVSKLPWTHLTKNGDELFMEIASHNIIYNNRKAILSLGIDVTEQVRAREALGKNQAIFRSLIDHAADAIFMVDIMGYIFDINQSASELLQYSRDELIGMNVLDLNLPEKRATIPATIWDKLKKENTLINESVLLKKDGTSIEVEISRKMLPDKSGAIAIVRDITERKRIERALILSEEKHRALVENISDGILMLDENKQVLYQSDAIEQITGYSYTERKNKSVENYAYPEDVPMIRRYYTEAIASPGITIPISFRVIHKKGHIVWAEGSIINLLDNESVKAFVINYRDVTERRRHEEQQLLMTSIVNSSDDAIISKNLHGIITSWNQGAEKVLGYKADEIIGKPITLLMPEELVGEEKDILYKIAKGESIDHYETRRIKKNGDQIFVSLTISPIRNILGQITGASKILRDITERTLFEQKLAKALIKTQEEERYEIGGELHDNVCQILVASLIYLSMMKKKMPEEDHKLYDQTKQMIQMASDEIRNLSHQLAPALFDNATLNDAFMNLLSTINVENKYIIDVHFNEMAKKHLLSREMQLNLYRILQEQLRNITKHAHAHSIEISVSVVDHLLTMRIADDGVGFDTNSKKQGIGFANMNRRVQLFHGVFSVKSSEGTGCEIRVEIPV